MSPSTPKPDDWRRQGQERFLKGRTWVLRSYRPYRDGWDHDHCELCASKLSLSEGDLHRGFVSTDNYHWVCEPCFTDFQGEMAWIVEPS
jgi:hypothetical protein